MQPGARARGAARRPKPSEFDPDQHEQDEDDQPVADQQRRDDRRVGMIGVKPAKTRKVASARTNAPPTAKGPNRAVGPLSSKGARLPAPLFVVAPSKP